MKIPESWLTVEGRPFAVYTFYDVENAPLYIGLSMSMSNRLRSHMYTQPWWSDVESIGLQFYAGYEDAVDAERREILEHLPKYNRARYKPRKRPDRGAHYGVPDHLLEAPMTPPPPPALSPPPARRKRSSTLTAEEWDWVHSV